MCIYTECIQLHEIFAPKEWSSLYDSHTVEQGNGANVVPYCYT